MNQEIEFNGREFEIFKKSIKYLSNVSKYAESIEDIDNVEQVYFIIDMLLTSFNALNK